MEKLKRLIAYAVANQCSDLHITGSHPAVFRKDGVIRFEKNILFSHQEMDSLVKNLLPSIDLRTLSERLSADLALTFDNIRVRMNVFNTTRGLSIAFRLLPGKIPSIDSLNLHPSLKDFCKLPSGLLLICGATGSGKSTTIAAMIDEINRTRPLHIVSLEDPVEYRFISDQSFVEQRELGRDFPSFKQGLIDVLREDPDVIMVGELRESEPIRLTLNAVESGHLVIASLHATHSEDALYRLCNSFPSDAQNLVRTQLSSVLSLLLIQKLVYLPDKKFRIPYLSILKGTQAVKGVIREDKFAQIESILQTGRLEGMFTMESYARDYLKQKPHFTSPSQIFRPSRETTEESIYQSPLVNNPPVRHTKEAYKESCMPQKQPSYTIPEKKPSELYQKDGNSHYVIYEENSFQDVLNEINSKNS
ncbi:MAG: Flp pilus assembly complex ATPase component TadA [Proteobacteria bacterium]|nr:Flp pilus assembly complex ATPase component TadA [Pseudomonadota bacterium]